MKCAILKSKFPLPWGVVLVVACWTGLTTAQSPDLGYVFPPFVERGKSTEVALGGYDFTPDMQFLVHGDEIALETDGGVGRFLLPPRPYWEGPRVFSNALPIPREVQAIVTPAAEGSSEVVYWQVANANGISKTALFHVSDQREILEQRFRDRSMNLDRLPVGVSGRLSRLTEKDGYTFTADKTGVVELDVWARRVGSNVNIAVQVYDGGSVKIVDLVDTIGRDLKVAFPVEKGKSYEFHLHDADFRGAAQFVYRVLVKYKDPSDGLPANHKRLGLTETVKTPIPVRAGVQYKIAALSQALGGDLDLQLSLVDREGNVVAENDDTSGNTLDAVVVYSPKEDGTVTAVITGSLLSGVEGHHVYELQISEVQRGYELTVPQFTTAALGQKMSIAVGLTRYGGFSEEVQLSVIGLPAGITLVDGASIGAGKNKGTLQLEVADDAAVQGNVVRIVGDSVPDEAGQRESLKVVATAAGAGSLVVTDPAFKPTSDIVLGVTMTPPFSVHVVDKDRQRVVHRGSTYPAPLQVNRNEGYEGVIRVMMKAQQSRHRMGMEGPVVEVPPDAVDVLFPCFMPEWLTTDRTSRMVVLAYGEMPDPAGRIRHVAVAADARITMILEGALLKVGELHQEMQTRAGDAFEIPVEIFRSSKLQTPILIDLELSQDLAGLIQCDPIMLPVGESKVVLKVKSLKDERLQGVIPITVRATTMQDGMWKVKSIRDLQILFE
ncbi:MAG: hypothetical protein VX738_15380 [Planctomycetota bacterium]|nr:hypothetical protein [Planctomycetota bacterium]